MNIAFKVAIAGFAIFSMIFGSSNIVFPLIIGKDYASNWQVACLGWCVATVFLPMIGYFGAMLYEADSKKYLAPLGKHLTFLIMLIIMIMAGPFGVVARGVNVSFGGFGVLIPSMNELFFNLTYCAITVFMAWNPSKIVKIMGMVFTPLKFGGMVLVIAGALYFGNGFENVFQSAESSQVTFSESFKMGYQTLDLLSAFVMAFTIYSYIKNALPENQRENKKLLLKFVGLACVVGGIVLAGVYFGLTSVGAQYSLQLQSVPNESLFPKIAEIAMGAYAAWFVAIVIAACCLATNVVLSSAFTDFVHKDILKGKIKRKVLLPIVGAVTFFMSLLGFEKICEIMSKILGFVYPFLIIFVIVRIAYYYGSKARQK